VDNAKFIAHELGVSDQVIGLTVVALGTSLPELATTISALVKKEFSLSVGNVIGANILNIVLILSTCSIISPAGLQVSMQPLAFFKELIPQALVFDLPVVLLVSLIVIVPAWIKGRLYRWQGITLLSVYALYIGYLAIGMF
jgi:cation:H+ antiporter